MLEYVPGGSLKDRLRGPIAPRAAAHLLGRIAGAVAAIHRAGLLHLDLKPSNVLIDGPADAPWERVVPKVSDFGIARLLPGADAGETSLAGPCGTPSYMAPEQAAADADALGPATDVYALGAILYELLTDRPPFGAASAVETLDQVRHLDPVPPRALNPGIPRDLETICAKCLRKEPGRRYPSAEALADDLARWLDGRPIAARPVSSPERMWRWCRRRPATALPLAALALTLVFGLASLSLLLRRTEAERDRAETAGRAAEANYRLASGASTSCSSSPSTPAAASQRMRTTSARPASPPWRPPAAGLVELRRRYPGGVAEPRRLAQIDFLIAHIYRNQRRLEESLRLFEESIALWEESIPRAPNVDEAKVGQLGEAFSLADTADILGDQDSFERWDAQVAPMVARASPSSYYVEAVMRLTLLHRRFADNSARRGDVERARRVLEDDLRLFDAIDEARASHPVIVMGRLSTLAALGRPGDEIKSLGGVPHPLPPSPLANDAFRLSLSELAARRCGWTSLGTSPVSAGSDDAWADRIVASILSLCAATGLGTDEVPRIGLSMMNFGSGTSGDQRRNGRLADARRTVGQLLALAARIVRDYPDRPEGLILLSEAYNQLAKNERRGTDDVKVRRALQQSLDAAHRAVTLDPTMEVARRILDDRRRRVATYVRRP